MNTKLKPSKMKWTKSKQKLGFPSSCWPVIKYFALLILLTPCWAVNSKSSYHSFNQKGMVGNGQKEEYLEKELNLTWSIWKKKQWFFDSMMMLSTWTPCARGKYSFVCVLLGKTNWVWSSVRLYFILIVGFLTVKSHGE